MLAMTSAIFVFSERANIFCKELPVWFFKKRDGWGIWVAQLVEHLALDFSSGHDLTVCEFEPCIRLCAGSMEPA